MPRGVKKTTTETGAPIAEPTLEELRAQLAPKSKPQPTAEQVDKDKRIEAIQASAANYADELVSFISVAGDVDSASEGEVRKLYKLLKTVSNTAIAGVKAIPSSRYEDSLPAEDDFAV